VARGKLLYTPGQIVVPRLKALKAGVCCAKVANSTDNTTQIVTKPPEPTYEMARFLSWLKKLHKGAGVSCKRCEKKWGPRGFDFLSTIKEFDENGIIAIYKIPGGDKVVYLRDKGWADGWTRHYDLEIPHHRQWQEL